MNWFKRFLSGLAIGIGAAIPGVSGGTIAVILKVYEKIVSAVSNIFKKFKESFTTLLPVLLGVILALIPCIILMKVAFENILFAIVTLFAAFIIGSLPGIKDEIKNEKPTKKNITILIVCFVIAVAIGLLSFFLGEKINLKEQMYNPQVYFYFIAILIGILGSSALVVPGISGSMILLVIGFYKPLIKGITDFVKNLFQGKVDLLNWQFFGVVMCFALGIIIGFIFISKLMKVLLAKWRTACFYGIIGFIIGSIISLYVNYDMREYYKCWGAIPEWSEIILAIVLFIIGILAGVYLVHLQRKQKIAQDSSQN